MELEELVKINKESIIRHIPNCLERARAEKLWKERMTEYLNKGYSRINSLRYALHCLEIQYKNYLK